MNSRNDGVNGGKAKASRAILLAAQTLLAEQGFRQIGKGRVWIKDHAFWVAFIEFQPSAWARGSYINVGATWLWNEREHLAFDFVKRVSSFKGFDDGEDSSPERIETLAKTALSGIEHIEQSFHSIDQTALLLTGLCSTNRFNWTEYNAGIACGLSGATERAQLLLSSVAQYQSTHRPGGHLEMVAKKFACLVDKPDSFLHALQDIVYRMRLQLGLRPAHFSGWPARHS